MKHVNYLSFFLLTLFSISFISCSDDDDNKLNTGITNQSWTEGKSLEISQDNELSVSFNAAAKWVASVTSGADKTRSNTDYIEPQDAVNWQKIRRIVVAADAYIKHFCLDAPVRFDIITAVGEPGAFRIEHLKEAFYPPMF